MGRRREVQRNGEERGGEGRGKKKRWRRKGEKRKRTMCKHSLSVILMKLDSMQSTVDTLTTAGSQQDLLLSFSRNTTCAGRTVELTSTSLETAHTPNKYW